MDSKIYSDYRSGRDDLSRLDVHVPCLRVVGPTEHGYQACVCEPRSPWPGHDVSRIADLCSVCARGTAGGSSRWSWLGCACCRAVELELRALFGICVLPLGRHSIMNGVGRRLADRDSDAAFALSLNNLFTSQDRLHDWAEQESRGLAARLVGSPDRVPLLDWLTQFPASPERSVHAYERFLGVTLPADLPDLAAQRLVTEADDSHA